MSKVQPLNAFLPISSIVVGIVIDVIASLANALRSIAKTVSPSGDISGITISVSAQLPIPTRYHVPSPLDSYSRPTDASGFSGSAGSSP